MVIIADTHFHLTNLVDLRAMTKLLCELTYSFVDCVVLKVGIQVLDCTDANLALAMALVVFKVANEGLG